MITMKEGYDFIYNAAQKIFDKGPAPAISMSGNNLKATNILIKQDTSKIIIVIITQTTQ